VVEPPRRQLAAHVLVDLGPLDSWTTFALAATTAGDTASTRLDRR
jgi:hypothetical protein